MRQVIEEAHPLGEMERMVERRAEHRRAEPDAVRVGGRHRERHLGRGHRLPAAGVMLADVELVEAELVGEMDQRDVALERQRRVLARIVHGIMKNENFMARASPSVFRSCSCLRRSSRLGHVLPSLRQCPAQHTRKPLPDRLLPRLTVDLLSREVGHVEHVDRFFAVGRDVRRRDVERQVRQRARQFVEQPRPVEPRRPRSR